MHTDNSIERFGGFPSHFASIIVGLVSTAVFRLLNLTRVYGRKNIPRQKHGVLLVANHQTMVDSFFICSVGYFPEVIIYPSQLPVNFAAEENYFRHWYLRVLMWLLRTVPVKGRKDTSILRKYQEYLKQYNALVFYQGTRSHDLSLVKSGPAWTIAHSEEPLVVIPVFIDGVDKIFGGPKTHGFWHRWRLKSIMRRMVIAFGERLDFSDLNVIQDSREKIAAINARIIAAMHTLEEQYALKPTPAT